MKINTRDALKLAISVPVALLLALSFGWEKPYWAAVTVIVLSTNESFGHSLKTGQQRILGAALGTLISFTLVALFPQSPVAFIVAFVSVSAILVYLSGCVYHGYLFKMAFTVCTLIAMVGNFDNVTTFNIAIIRLQETILGVLVFTFVYTFLWPQKTEDVIAAQFKILEKQYRIAISTGRFKGINQVDFDVINLNVERTKALLQLPLSGSYNVTSNFPYFRLLLASYIEGFEQLRQTDNNAYLAHCKRYNNIKKYGNYKAFDELDIDSLASKLLSDPTVLSSLNAKIKPKSTLLTNYKQRLVITLQNVCIIVSAFAIWMYLPVPGGTTFPMLACVLANTITSMPRTIMHDIIGGFLFFSVFVLIQFVLLLPALTEAWQLGLFYFINLLIMSIGCDIFKQPLQKVIGPQLLVVLTNGPLHLTPTYDIQTPIIMVIMVFMSLALTKFFIDLIQFNQRTTC
ncbi:FUSC family protein [Vibrio methylphosphonaticus]|uniref:FUSC family protein n=1 Tax=Vibrio methylphosphonaticus TaxID=2946866 RepID=UPI00202A8AD6|nr:FUSC family protein [Vibrio methylphosphonaticus]MCL9776588.1 FUSC family protein [Vibrio methylphosphonaticus]